MSSAHGPDLPLTGAGLDIREAIGQWKTVLGDRSANTIKIYIRSAEKLTNWLEANDLPTAVTEIDAQTLRLFFAQLGGAESSRSQIYRSLQQFFKFLVARETVPTSALAKVQAPSQKPFPVTVIATDDLRRLLAPIREGSSFEDRRDHALLRLLIDTGMRVGELASMELDDLDVTRRVIAVGRRTSERILLLEPPTAAALRRYLEVRSRHRAAARPALWLATKGSRAGVLTHWGIRQMIDRRVQRAGLPGRIHPQKFRSTYAYRWLTNGGQAHDLMHNVGLRSPSMVARYGAPTEAERAHAASLRASLADQI